MLSMIAGVAVALLQPPALVPQKPLQMDFAFPDQAEAKPADRPAAVAPKPAEPADKPAAKPETLDEQLQRAQDGHPDVRVATLQVELAKTKLEQERLRVTQRITAAHAAVGSARVNIGEQAKALSWTKRLYRSGTVSDADLAVQEKLMAQYQERFAAAEAELLAAVGGPATAKTARVVTTTTYQTKTVMEYKALPSPAPPPAGFTADFARMLDARITPQLKKGTPHQLLTELLGKAAAAVGRPAPVVRLDMLLVETVRKDVRPLTLQGETDTLGVWLQQFDDELNSPDPAQPDRVRPKFNLLVRDYGLIVAQSGQAPSGAVTVADFWRRARDEKAAEAKPAPAKTP